MFSLLCWLKPPSPWYTSPKLHSPRSRATKPPTHPVLVLSHILQFHTQEFCRILNAPFSLAGDLHFYMRHSFRPFQAAPPQPAHSEATKEAYMQPDLKVASLAPSVDNHSSSNRSHSASTGIAEPAASSAQNGGQALSSQPTNGLRHNHSFKFGPSMHAVPADVSNGSAKHAQHGTGPAASGSTAVHLRVSTGRQLSQASMPEPASASYASSSTSATSAEDIAELQSRRQSGDAASTSGQSTSSGWHPHDPEHLIVNGLGGAFLHPTHVFSPSRFVSGVAASLITHALCSTLTCVHSQIGHGHGCLSFYPAS